MENDSERKDLVRNSRGYFHYIDVRASIQCNGNVFVIVEFEEDFFPVSVFCASEQNGRPSGGIRAVKWNFREEAPAFSRRTAT